MLVELTLLWIIIRKKIIWRLFLNKINDVTNKSIRGFFFLSIGFTVSTIIKALTIILISRLLGPEDYGLYTVSIIIPTIIISICDVGISQALTRYIVLFRTQGKSQEVSILITIGISIKILLSFLISMLFIFFSNWIANTILNRANIVNLLLLTSFFILGEATLGTLKSIFIGLDKAEYSSLLMNVDAIIKVIVSPSLVILGYGAAGAIIGLGAGVFISSIMGLIMLFRSITFTIFDNKKEYYNSILNIAKLILPYGIPIYLSVIITVFSRQILRIVISLFESNANIGNYATAVNFTIIFSVIITPISSSLLPAFSKLNFNKERDILERMFKLSVKYTSLIMVPASLVVSSLSVYLVGLLYGLEYQTAPKYLSLYILLYLSSGFGKGVIQPFFNGQGNTKVTLMINILKFISSIPIAWFLIPRWGIPGIIIAILISEFISTLFGLFMIRKIYQINIVWKATFQIFFTSVGSYLILRYLKEVFPIESIILSLLFGCIVYFTSFLILASITGAIDAEDVKNFKKFVNALPIGKGLLNYILGLMEVLLKLSLIK